MFKSLLIRLTSPLKLPNTFADIMVALPRIICGLLLTIDFGGSKFGMPWTDPEKGLSLFEVAAWFPEDVAAFGLPFSLAPHFFAWMGAASEAIGGLFLVFGFQTRISAFFIACTMLVAIFFQKWGNGSWPLLPAAGFLWMSVYCIILGSGRLGIDKLIANYLKKASALKNVAPVLVLLFFVFSAKGQDANGLVKGEVLEKDSVLRDIALLEKALTEIHPGIYRYNTKESMKAAFTNLRAQVTSNMSEAELMKRMAQTIAKIRCGHTYLNPWNMNKALRDRLFGGAIYIPLGFKVIEEKFYVTHHVSSIENMEKGAEILAINGVAINAIYDSLRTIAKTDGNNFSPVDQYLSVQNYTVRNWNAFDLYYPLFFPLKQPTFELTFQNYGTTEKNTVTVQALKKEVREEKMKAKYGDEILGNSSWKLDVSNPQVAIMKIGTFATWNWKNFNSKQWFEEAFNEINSKGIPNLVVDIRGNGGGLDEPRNQLLSYLTNSPINCDDVGKSFIKTNKISDTLMPYVDSYAKIVFKGIPRIMYKKYNDEWYELKKKADCKNIKPRKNSYKGNVFILGGASNVSTTYTLLDRAKTYGFATYVGNTSGGNQQGINGGVYAFFNLPYTKIEVDIPLIYYAPANSRPDAGLSPNVAVVYTQKDIAHGTDPHIAYVKNSIR